MAAHAATIIGPMSAGKPPPAIVRLWKDNIRTEQLNRLAKLELQPGDEMGNTAHGQALLLWQQLPAGTRVDLPSPRAFGRTLGLFRTCATIKDRKIIQLELSAEEIAGLVGYSKSTIEAVLRWLGCNRIDYEGQKVSHGLGVLHRGRRTAWAYIRGKLQRVYRTSRITLTSLGRMLLGLGLRAKERLRDKYRRPVRAEQRQNLQPVRTGEQIFVQGQKTDDPEATTSTGHQWLATIQSKF